MLTLQSPDAHEVAELAKRGYLWAHFDLATRVYAGRGFRQDTKIANQFLNYALYTSNVNAEVPHSEAVHQELDNGHPYLKIENIKTLLTASLEIKKSPLALLQRNRVLSVDGMLKYERGVSGIDSYKGAYQDLHEVCKFTSQQILKEFSICAAQTPAEFRLKHTSENTELLLDPITQARRLLSVLRNAADHKISEQDIEQITDLNQRVLELIDINKPIEQENVLSFGMPKIYPKR